MLRSAFNLFFLTCISAIAFASNAQQSKNINLNAKKTSKTKATKDALATSIYNRSDTNQYTNDNKLGYGAHALTETNMSGFSLGLGGGLSHTMVKYQANSDKPYTYYPPGEAELAIKTEAGKTMPIALAFFGYGKQIERFYIGAELYGGYDFAKVTSFDNTLSGNNHGFWATTVKHGFYYGLSPRIGYKLAPSLLAYIGVNIEMGKWETKTVPDSDISQDVSLPYNGSAGGIIGQSRVNESLRTTKTTKNALTFAPRIGIDVMLTRTLFMRAEYSYLFGPKTTTTLNTAGIYAVASDSVTQQFSVTQQRFLLSIGYKF